jgi:parallel beta-helix repeat protein
MAPEDRYFIEGAAELLDEPGEWYLDRKTATLYYFPMSGEAMLNTQVVIPLYTNVMLLDGKPDKGAFVEHVVFHGITFANSEWYVPRDKPQIQAMKPAGFNQAAWGVPGAIRGQGVRDCLFQDCTIAHAGNYGIELGSGCQRNKISYCTMSDLGAGGIKLGETRIHLADAEQTRQNEVSDCTIADCGKTFPSAIGIWLGQTAQNLISHNDIHGLWYSGISIGWTWGYGNSLPRDNLVELNHVHHIGTPADGVEPILSDMGAIYTLGKQPGTIIRNNLFHDIAGLRYGGWGIYFDEGSSDIVAENNVVYRTTHGGFHQHYGENNIVRNNIFAFGRDSQIRRTRVEDHLSFTFEKNLVYWDSGTLLDGNWTKFDVDFDNNTYWHVGGEDFKFGKLTVDEWHKAGLDVHSQIRDPGFVDAQHNDFHLNPGAEKDLLGFVPFDVSTAGPRRVGH